MKWQQLFGELSHDKNTTPGALPGQDAEPGYFSVCFPQSAKIKAHSLEILWKYLSALFVKILQGFLWDLLASSYTRITCKFILVSLDIVFILRVISKVLYISLNS